MTFVKSNKKAALSFGQGAALTYFSLAYLRALNYLPLPTFSLIGIP